jgi:hypothetical protein
MSQSRWTHDLGVGGSQNGGEAIEGTTFSGTSTVGLTSRWRATEVETHVTAGNTETWRGVVTLVSEIETIIQRLRADAVGDVCSRSRVMDGLLDLRLGAAGLPQLVELIDSALADLPGRTMVPADWWRERLDIFELATLDPVEPVC